MRAETRGEDPAAFVWTRVVPPRGRGGGGVDRAEWLTPYTAHVKDAQAGKPLVNFLRGGLKEGFVKPSPYGKAVSEAARKKADGVKAQMMKGDFVIFKGPLKDNTGKTVIDQGVARKQTDVVLEEMNYLVEGVIGKV